MAKRKSVAQQIREHKARMKAAELAARPVVISAREQARRDAAMHVWRIDAPDKFLVRVCQYLSCQYPNPRQVIEQMQQEGTR